MLIAAGALVQFVKFMQITLLIILPLAVSAVAYTLYTHYRRRKKPARSKQVSDPVMHLLGATPEIINYQEIEGDYVHFDQSAIVKEYKSKLIYSHARYTALQKDYENLQDKCNTLLMMTETHSPNKKIIIMKNHEEQFISMVPVTTHDESPVTDAGIEDACLRDMLEEKKTEIAFLQTQLVQRIRNFHHAEKQLAEVRTRMEEAERISAASKSALEEEMQRASEKKELAARLQAELDQQIALVTEKQDTVLWLENTLRSTREQNEMLNAMVADNTDLVNALQASLAGEEEKVEQLKLKLDRNRQVMKRLFSELAQCVEPDTESSPVIELKAAFVKDQQSAFAETILP